MPSRPEGSGRRPARRTHHPGLFLLVVSIAVMTFIAPRTSVQVRRHHETNHTGWWYRHGRIPLIGSIAVLVCDCLEGSPGENRYGPQTGQAALF